MEFNNCTGLSKKQDVVKDKLKGILFTVFSLSFTSLPVPSHSLTSLSDRVSCKFDGTANNVNGHDSTDCSTRTRARTR